jgi:drug/metabolite transporter (DMT)-like permease
MIPQLIVLFASLLGAVGQIFFKKGSVNFQLLNAFKNWNFIVGVAFYAVALIMTMFAYKKAQVSILYPIVAFSYIFTVLLAGIFLKEPITLFKILGSSVIIGGVVLINL